MSKIYLDWLVGNHHQKNVLPEKFVPATVPGAVQLDYAVAHNFEPYYFDDHYKDYLWMEDEYWTYKTEFKSPELDKSQSLFFISKGIDYEFEIYLNDKLLHYQEGMFTHVKLDLTELLQSHNELKIIVFPAPKKHPEPSDRTQASHCCKPTVSYGWDWHPRLIPLGIWDDTFLEIKHESHINTIDFSYKLNADFSAADFLCEISGSNLLEKQCSIQIYNDKTELLSTHFDLIDGGGSLEGTLEGFELWWPHDMGGQSLYTLSIELSDNNGTIDIYNKKIGFRDVQLVMNEGTWDEPTEFPKSRSNPPITLQINGKRIFAKGTNWVNPDIFPGRITSKLYEKLMDLAVEANFNLLRQWGGAIVNKDSFYELCDEKGVLVWQEFPLACNDYESTPNYLKILEQESTSIINRLKNHPCLAMWCGGNELFNFWSGMDDQSLALRMLNSLCYQFDPNTPFIMTSPLMGMGHGHYRFRDTENGGTVFNWMTQARNTAYTEFAVPGISSIENLRKIIPQNNLFPPKSGTSWETHHAFGAWQNESHLLLETIQHYFGEPENLEQLIEYSQLLQSEGLKCIYEEARRQKPYCSMALNWCFNDAWPNAANCSIINWPSDPKPSFYAVKNSCRPVLVSARVIQFEWNEGDEFSAEIWMLNDSYNILKSSYVEIFIESESFSKKLLDWSFDDVPENQNIKGPTVNFVLPQFEDRFFKIVLKVDNHPEYNSEYTFLYHKKMGKTFETKQLNQ